MAERYISRFKKPTPYEREILTIMQEECAEIIVAISKAIRFGMKDGYPGKAETNLASISREIGDLECMIDMARSSGLIDQQTLEFSCIEKRERVARFMQSSPGASDADQ